MHIPSQEQWQKVIDTLKSVLHLARAEENFFMGLGISHKPCGTVCCVGGWYKVAKTSPEEIPNLVDDDWEAGKHSIGQDLGFLDGDEFKVWAIKNESLWGNNLGYQMFVFADAYNAGMPDAYAQTLQDVINHYEFVKQQCYAYTNQKPVANGN